MATESVNYQCPSCMGPLHFEGADGKLHCDYCGGAFTPAEVEAAYAAKQQKADAQAESDTERAEAGERSDFERMGDEAAGAASVLTNETISAAKEVSASASDPIQAYLSRASWNEDEREGMRSFTCSSCGAAVTVDATTAVSECPYCGNPAVVPGTFSNEAKPDFIIPFKVSKEEATSALTSYYKGKKFLPKEFVQSNRIAHMQGVYVPFWLYDGNAEGSATYECKNIRVYTSGDEEVTETDVYEAYREGSLDFERIPADSSAKMPDAHMDAIEPFDFDELVPFSVAYLPGYLAERYDQEADTCQPRAVRRMKGSLEDELQATVTGYDDVTQESINANSEVTGLSQALFPVWLLHTLYKDEDYLFAMNGQTGRFIGDLPVSPLKVVLWFLGIFLVCMAILIGLDVSVFQFDDELTSVLVDFGIPLAIATFMCIAFYNQMKTAREQTDARGYITMEGLTLTGSDDRYVTTHITRVRISKDDD